MRYTIIDNSSNRFNLNEVVFKTEQKNEKGQYLFKSLERNYSEYIYEIQATPIIKANGDFIQFN